MKKRKYLRCVVAAILFVLWLISTHFYILKVELIFETDYPLWLKILLM